MFNIFKKKQSAAYDLSDLEWKIKYAVVNEQSKKYILQSFEIFASNPTTDFDEFRRLIALFNSRFANTE
jgi:hypothetical protein